MRSYLIFALFAASFCGCHDGSAGSSDLGAVGDAASSFDLATGDALSSFDLATGDGPSSFDLATGDAASGSCSPAMVYGGGEMSLLASSVTAKVVDETGAAVANQPVYICGLNLCSSPATTANDGTVTITTNLTETKPAFKVGDTIAYAEVAIPLTVGATDLTASGTKVLTLGRLSNKTGATLTPGMDATSGDVTVSVPAGATVGIDGLVYATADSQKLRTVSIPLANDGPILASSGHSDFSLFYGLSPAETLICPAAKVTVQLPHDTSSPNNFGWAAGSAVEFWIMTVDTAQTYAPYAGWAKMSDGVVSSDGTSVSTTSGQGFIFLESFAIRKP